MTYVASLALERGRPNGLRLAEFRSATVPLAAEVLVHVAFEDLVAHVAVHAADAAEGAAACAGPDLSDSECRQNFDSTFGNTPATNKMHLEGAATFSVPARAAAEARERVLAGRVLHAGLRASAVASRRRRGRVATAP